MEEVISYLSKEKRTDHFLLLWAMIQRFLNLGILPPTTLLPSFIQFFLSINIILSKIQFFVVSAIHCLKACLPTFPWLVYLLEYSRIKECLRTATIPSKGVKLYYMIMRSGQINEQLIRNSGVFFFFFSAMNSFGNLVKSGTSRIMFLNS